MKKRAGAVAPRAVSKYPALVGVTVGASAPEDVDAAAHAGVHFGGRTHVDAYATAAVTARTIG